MKRLLVILLIMITAMASSMAQEVKREISRVSFDIYHFQNNFHFNMFVITGAGVVVEVQRTAHSRHESA